MSGPLSSIPDGVLVMVDANILVYAFSPDVQYHESCRLLIERGAKGTVRLASTVSIAGDVIHRVMLAEAIALGWAQTSLEAVSHLKRRLNLVSQLTRYRLVLAALRQAQVNILPLTYRELHGSRKWRDQFGLLTEDSLIVAVMEREHIQFIATNDTDFERVPGIAVRKPADQA